jgi:hypothetical protein
MGTSPPNVLLVTIASFIMQHRTRLASRPRIACLITTTCWQMKIENSNVSSNSRTQLVAIRPTMTFCEEL